MSSNPAETALCDNINVQRRMSFGASSRRFPTHKYLDAMEEIDDLELSFMKEANKDCGELQQEVDEKIGRIHQLNDKYEDLLARRVALEREKLLLLALKDAEDVENLCPANQLAHTQEQRKEMAEKQRKMHKAKARTDTQLVTKAAELLSAQKSNQELKDAIMSELEEEASDESSTASPHRTEERESGVVRRCKEMKKFYVEMRAAMVGISGVEITNGSAEDKVTVHFRPCGDKESEAYLTLQLNPDNGELEGASVSPPISDKMRLERFAVIQRKAIADNDLVSLVTEFRAVLME